MAPSWLPALGLRSEILSIALGSLKLLPFTPTSNSLKPAFQNKGESLGELRLGPLNTNSILFYFQPDLHTHWILAALFTVMSPLGISRSG